MATRSAKRAGESAEETVRVLADAMEPVIYSVGSASKSVTRSVTEATARILLVSGQPLRMAFLARAMNALAALTMELGEEALGNATGASSDYQVLLCALETPDALRTLQRLNPLTAARLRGLFARSRLLDAEGGALTVDDVAKILHLTRQGVDKRRRARKLLGLDAGRRGYLYPAWQFGLDGLLPGIEEVLEVINVHDPWMRTAFFLNGNDYLAGETPLAELRRGHLDEVRRAAGAYGEQGAA
jgi:hypothetical protein